MAKTLKERVEAELAEAEREGAGYTFAVRFKPTPDGWRWVWTAYEGKQPCPACKERARVTSGQYTFCDRHWHIHTQLMRLNNRRLVIEQSRKRAGATA